MTNPVPLLDRTLGRYRLQGYLSRGGQGKVYLALDTRLGRQVAIKELLPELAARAHFRQRFKREARHAARVSHPYVASVYDAFSHQGELFLVMELVPGETLAARLRRQTLSVAEAGGLALEAAEALEAIHAARLIHRDLKPGNLMLTPDGHIKLMDFGLARRIFDPEAETAEETPLTAEGVAVGTHAYMSPEQLRCQPLDGRSDLFSLGVTLYEALCGLHTSDATPRPRRSRRSSMRPPGWV